jgi:hypothetical protein
MIAHLFPSCLVTSVTAVVRLSPLFSGAVKLLSNPPVGCDAA